MPAAGAAEECARLTQRGILSLPRDAAVLHESAMISPTPPSSPTPDSASQTARMLRRPPRFYAGTHVVYVCSEGPPRAAIVAFGARCPGDRTMSLRFLNGQLIRVQQDDPRVMPMIRVRHHQAA